MKAIFLILLYPILLLSVIKVNAQTTPWKGLNGINYQAAIRSAVTQGLVSNTAIQLKFTILPCSGCEPSYSESQSVTTSLQGIVSVVIGKGTPIVGLWENIPWSSGTVWLKVEADIDGKGFLEVATTQFQSVPYAQYAANGGGGSGGGGGTGLYWQGTFTSAPPNPSTNYAYYNSVDRTSYIYDSTGVWQILVKDGAAVTWLGQFAAEPTGAVANQAYYNMTDRKSYIYDGTTWQTLSEDGLQGIGISWLGSFATAPGSPTLNQAYYNSADRTAYLYDGTQWVVMAEGGTGWNLSGLDYLTTGQLGLTTTANGDTTKSTKRVWLTTGNTGTNSNSDFVGTLDTAAFVIKTNGNGTKNERLHFTSTPRIFVNGTADTAASQGQAVFTVFGGGAPLALNGSEPQTDHAINGYNSNSTAAIYGRNYSNGYGIHGVSSAGAGVYGWSNSRGSIPIKGENQSQQGGYGIFGFTRTPYFYLNTAYGAGVLGWAQAANGVGVLGVGNSLDYTNPSLLKGPNKGAGVMGNGSGYGVVGMGGVGSSNTGVGVAGGGSNQDVIIPATGGAGVSGSGFIGVVGYGRSLGAAATYPKGEVGHWGAYFDNRNADGVIGVYTYIAGVADTSMTVGLASNGSKSTIIKDETGSSRLLYCTEAPEILFQDFGMGELKDGKARIDLETLLTQHIRVDATHPLKVFIQLEGECNGVFVTNKSANGFDVKELQGGKSNVGFTWQIVASRADEEVAGATVRYSDQRFAKGPSVLPSIIAGRSDSTETAPAAPAKVELKSEEASIVSKAFSNLQFASAKAEIAKVSYSSLNELANLLKAHPEWHVTLSGHTDNEGTPVFNMALSENRSEAVKHYLTAKGVDADHITTIGYGQTKPLSAENTKAGKEKNRRVEIAIYSERP